jgi:hypothetical protein
MVLSPKLNDLCRSVSLSVHCDKRKEKDRLFVGEGPCRGLYDPCSSARETDAPSGGYTGLGTRFLGLHYFRHAAAALVGQSENTLGAAGTTSASASIIFAVSPSRAASISFLAYGESHAMEA